MKWLAFGCCLWFCLSIAACGSPPEKNVEVPEKKVADKSVPPPAPAAKPVGGETRKTYQWYCAQCHGTEGRGNGINAQYLTVKPLDHTKAEYLSTRTDEHLFNAIKQGGLAVGRAPCMPAWGHTLDDAVIRDLVRYIRELCNCTQA